MRSTTSRQLLALGLLALLSLYLGFVRYEGGEAVLLVKKLDYWLLLSAFLLLAYNLWLWGKGKGWPFFARDELKRSMCPALFILAVCFLLYGMQTAGFKIVMDEPALVATSLQMHEEKESMTAGRGYEVNGSFLLLGGHIDKRPSFYPFLLSLLHDLTGYRSSQGVVLNTLLTPVFLTLLFLAGNLVWKGRMGGYIAVALFATVPLLAMNVNGSGFELLTLVMLLSTALAAYAYLRSPSPVVLNVLILLGVLLAQTRYESVLYVFSVAGVIAFSWFRVRRIELTWTAVITPLLLICVPLRRAVFEVSPVLWQLDYKNADSPFSLAFLSENLLHANNFFFAVSRDQPNSLLLSVLFVLALSVLAVLILRKKLRFQSNARGGVVLLAFGAIVIGNFFLLMVYYWGQIDDIMATRIVLPFLLFQVIFVVAVVSKLESKRRKGLFVLATSAAFFIGVTRPIAASSDFLDRSIAQQEVTWLRQQVKREKDRTLLYLNNRSLAPILERVSAVSIERGVRAKSRLDLHLRLKTFDDIYIAYMIPTDPTTFPLEAREKRLIEENLGFEVVTERSLGRWGKMRLARLTEVYMDSDMRAEVEAEINELFQGESDIQDFARTLP